MSPLSGERLVSGVTELREPCCCRRMESAERGTSILEMHVPLTKPVKCLDSQASVPATPLHSFRSSGCLQIATTLFFHSDMIRGDLPHLESIRYRLLD
ncbi:unnamed protein product [Spirodela intermedia]|uniref:Uncharacterized protein n=1 Tax=Spirodela intermedia TaxID=51605 RepID=A0A7I8J125_SPIIN|nr:unnamed protein product [Spirodela intermedia]CAA6663837.1 unnamed protein product [Spirodela intermedia]